MMVMLTGNYLSLYLTVLRVVNPSRMIAGLENIKLIWAYLSVMTRGINVTRRLNKPM
jgi:hypothetical protein